MNTVNLTKPSTWVTRFTPLIKSGGKVLDLASGNGRHSVYMKNLGFDVTAIDRDHSAFCQDYENIELLETDLENEKPWILEGYCFDGIVVTNYLFRPLFPHIINSLSESGVLIYETFCRGNEIFGKPKNPDYLLSSGELFSAFCKSLRVIAYEEGIFGKRTKSAKQRICAVNGDLPPIPPSSAEN